jgi:chromate transport protein ChrA
VSHALTAFLRASGLHIGAAAATAALREELVQDHGVSPDEVDTAYAVSRLTPGTNLLALYAQLGSRLGGWPLALGAVAVGAVVPAIFAVTIAVAYEHSRSAAVAAIMAGARAGGVAVFIGAAVRLLKPQIVSHPRMAVVVATVAALVSMLTPADPIVILLLAGIAGPFLFRPT